MQSGAEALRGSRRRFFLTTATAGELDALVAAAGLHAARIDGGRCRGKAALLDELARALALPDYFGHNWDALEECLDDLRWRGNPRWLMVFADAHALLADEPAELPTLLAILADAFPGDDEAAGADLKVLFAARADVVDDAPVVRAARRLDLPLVGLR